MVIHVVKILQYVLTLSYIIFKRIYILASVQLGHSVRFLPVELTGTARMVCGPGYV